MSKLSIAIQIYTLRDTLKDGYENTFKHIADTGYSGVELVWDPDHGDVIKDLLAKYKLVGTGTHVGLDALENDYSRVIEYLKKIGSTHPIIPGVNNDYFHSVDSMKELCGKIEVVAKKLADDGCDLGFHNHTSEYGIKLAGRTIMDIFYDEAPSLKFEVDCGWAWAAGADVIASLKKIGDRLAFIHVKDIDEKNVPTEVGNGIVNMPKIFDTAASLGVKWGVVEQDSCTNFPPFDAVAVSKKYIDTING
ncbi:sugar phosphate isomerase [Clostridia bacterium]|nr:sugar phosphate isomerase [Clostridia bacterium]